MLKTAYSRYLEEQIRTKDAKIEALEKRNHELVLVLIEKTPAGAIFKPETPRHHISRGSNSAKCSCGWASASNDPGKLQDEIQNHFRSYSASAPVRKSWPQIRSLAESESENT